MRLSVADIAVDGAGRVLREIRKSDGEISIIITRSSGEDGAVLVLIDTTFEPNGTDGGPGLRVLINDAEVTECTASDFVLLAEVPDPPREATQHSLEVQVAQISYLPAS